MFEIQGTIRTSHNKPACVAEAISADNLSAMETSAAEGAVVTTISGKKLRSTIASVDDYLMNLAIAEDICTHVSH